MTNQLACACVIPLEHKSQYPQIVFTQLYMISGMYVLRSVCTGIFPQLLLHTFSPDSINFI